MDTVVAACMLWYACLFGEFPGKREIQALAVKCSNVDGTCEWQGTVGTLSKHMAMCPFTPLPCPKKCVDKSNTISQFMKKDLDEHLEKDCPNRDYQCQYCQEKGTYTNITQVHDSICENKMIPCTNTGCNDTIPRNALKRHFAEDCEYTEIPCKYQRLGCDKKMIRKAISTHENDTDKLHLHMALQKIITMENNFSETKQSTNDAINALKTCQTRKSITFGTFGNYQREFKSPSFYTSPNGYYMNASVTINKETKALSFSLSILEGKYDTALQWPFQGRATLSLLNQLDDTNHFERKIDFSKHAVMAGGNLGFVNFISRKELVKTGPKIKYFKDQTLYFRVLVEIPETNTCKPWLDCTPE